MVYEAAVILGAGIAHGSLEGLEGIEGAVILGAGIAHGSLEGLEGIEGFGMTCCRLLDEAID